MMMKILQNYAKFYRQSGWYYTVGMLIALFVMFIVGRLDLERLTTMLPGLVCFHVGQIVGIGVAIVISERSK